MEVVLICFFTFVLPPQPQPSQGVVTAGTKKYMFLCSSVPSMPEGTMCVVLAKYWFVIEVAGTYSSASIGVHRGPSSLCSFIKLSGLQKAPQLRPLVWNPCVPIEFENQHECPERGKNTMPTLPCSCTWEPHSGVELVRRDCKSLSKVLDRNAVQQPCYQLRGHWRFVHIFYRSSIHPFSVLT